MSYATLQDLIVEMGQAELVQLSDRAEPPSGDIDVAVVELALEEADELIDGYLAAKYRLPLDPAPIPIKAAARDIARYRLYKDAPTEAVKERYKNALSLLKDIGAGRVRLDAAGIEPDGRGVASFACEERLFSRTSMGGF